MLQKRLVALRTNFTLEKAKLQTSLGIEEIRSQFSWQADPHYSDRYFLDGLKKIMSDFEIPRNKTEAKKKLERLDAEFTRFQMFVESQIAQFSEMLQPRRT